MGIIGIGCHQDFEGLHFEIILTESKGSQEIEKGFPFYVNIVIKGCLPYNLAE